MHAVKEQVQEVVSNWKFSRRHLFIGLSNRPINKVAVKLREAEMVYLSIGKRKCSMVK
jgi:hypothetical protein